MWSISSPRRPNCSSTTARPPSSTTSGANYADLSWLFGLDDGERSNAHLGQPALAIFETAHQTPFDFNLHVGDVGHTLVLGATGSGKSFFISLLLAHAQRYRPRVTLFDLGGSYTRLLWHFAGQTLRLGLTNPPCTINPFAAPPTTEHLQFLFTFVRILIESGGQYTPKTADDRDLYEQIGNLYVLDPAQRHAHRSEKRTFEAILRACRFQSVDVALGIL